MGLYPAALCCELPPLSLQADYGPVCVCHLVVPAQRKKT